MSALPEKTDHEFTGDMADVAEYCGADIARALCEKLPGIEIKIPSVWTETSMLAALPRKVADAIIASFSAERLYIPTDKHSPNTRGKARALHKDGLTNPEIALQLGVSERHVRSLLNSEQGNRRADPNQIEMF